MRKLIGCVLFAVALALAVPAVADVCYNEATNKCAAAVEGICPEGSVMLAECPAGSEEPSWLDSVGIKLSESKVAKIIALLISLAAGVQLLKKVLADISKWDWLLRLAPPVANLVKFFSEGLGPLILNAALTITVVLPPLLSDGIFSIGDALTLGGVFFGNIAAFMGIKGTIESWSGKRP